MYRIASTLFLTIVIAIILTPCNVSAQSSGQWTKLDVPPGGSFTSILCVGDTLTVRGQYSPDRGDNWFPQHEPQEWDFHDLRFYHAFAQNWVLARHFSTCSTSLWCFDYSERVWKKVHDGFEAFHVLVHQDTVFIPTSKQGVLLSTDPSGKVWKNSGEGLDSERLMFTITMFRGRPVAGSRFGLFYMYKNGRWELFSNSPSGLPIFRIAANSRYLFATEETGGLIRSEDGKNWTRAPIQFAYSIWTALTVTDSIVIAGGAYNPHISLDGGETFHAETFGLSRVNVFDGVIIGDRIALSLNGPGVLLSDDYGVHWKFGTTSPNSVSSVAWVGNDRFIAMRGQPGIYTKKEGIWEWLRPGPFGTPASEEASQLLAVGSSLLYATKFAGYWKSDDAGKSWERMEELDAVSEAHLSVHNGVLFAAAQNFIGYSTDMGSSWRSGDVPFGFYPDAVRSLESTYYSCGRHVVRSVDGGSTWQTDREGLPSEEAYVSWSDPFGVYIGFQGPNAHQNWIYWKSNDSEPWEPLGIAPAEGGQVRSILSHGKQIFATGEDIRLSRLDDHMGPWYAWDEGLPDSRDARLLTVHDGWIYASPSRGGFYRRKLDGSTAVPRVPQHHQLPELSLHPQPADDILQLDVRDFASRGRSITVFDISGRCVAQRTVDGNAIISLTTESWDSGLYLVVLQGTWGMQTARCLIRH